MKGRTPDGIDLTRDEHGVPHVRAQDLGGLYWGMGYAHGIDRGMQMCLMRLLGQGRASECLDGSDEMLGVDTFFRRMNWAGGTQAEVDALEPDTAALCARYCEGVNAAFRKQRPWEFRLVSYRPEPWVVHDSVQMARMIGYLTLAQSQAEIERLFVELVQAGIDDDKLEALFPGCIGAGWDRELIESVTLGERIVPEAVRWLSGTPRVMASNNWVIAGSRTKSGQPIMANDPHLEVNRLPNVWAEMALRAPEHRFLGMTMPGVPAALIGRSEHLAWGATYTFMDAVDSWVEDCRDGTYRRGDEWVPFTVRSEVIRRKKGDDVTVTFYENEHGVLDGDPTVPGRYLATRWAPGTSGAQSLIAGKAVLEARSVEEGMAAFGRIETAWNWVFASSDGHIGYQMSGLMPRRAEGVTGFHPLPGWNSAWDWQGMVPPEELPRVVDPEDGYLVTANQDLNHLGIAHPINMPMGDYRAVRIAALLAERADHDMASCRAIQLDVRSIQADAFLDALLPLLPDDGPLHRWDRCYDLQSEGAALFEAFYAALRTEVFGADLGHPVMEHLAADTGIFIDFYANFDRNLLDAGSPWYGERSRDECFRAAFDAVASTSPGRWGTHNSLSMANIFFGGKLPAFLGFDRGPVELPGGRATPRQGQVYSSAGRVTSFAASVRLVAEMAEDTLHTSLAGGPSDRRFSRWYASTVDDWRAGVFKVVRHE